ncbi:hypothetical protein H0E87_009609, partial [Populus deltoides]
MLICSLLSGFNVETVEYKNISFTVWDVGGQDKWLKFFFLMPVIMDCLVLAIWPPPAYNIIRSYIPEDT